MTGKYMRIIILFFLVILIVVGGWILLYPSSNDPRNIKYVLWKSGLYQMDLNTIAAAMIGDRSREKLIIGKTKSQIENRFGILVSPSETSPYLGDYYRDSVWKNKDALFIGNSPWMIIFDKDRATHLILVKGN